MNKETIDIFDENHKLIGKDTKKNAHKLGLWHEVFACLLINSKTNKIYFQYKNPKHNDVTNLPKIDISVGGHLQSGETERDGVREIKEESSLIVKYEDLIKLPNRRIDKYIREDYIIREFEYIYLYDSNISLKDLSCIDDEVLYFIEFDIDELLDFIINNKSSIKGNTLHGIEEYYKENFIKAYLEDDHLYLNLLLLIKDYLNKKDLTKYIWQ